MINIIQESIVKNEGLAVEMVERKGIGHPDTLSDLVAEVFSNKYSLYCKKHYGVILNHWVDKVHMAGGTAKLTFGKVTVTRPITVYLFGRVTSKIEGKKIDVKSLFEESVCEVFSRIFDTEILKHVRYKVNVNCGIGKDHEKGYYFPKNADDIKNSWEKLVSNDTVICSGFAPYSISERVSIYLENLCNSKSFKKRFHETGWDVKVVVIRNEKKFEVTICLPFIASRTPTFLKYKEVLADAKKFIYKNTYKKLKDELGSGNFELKLFLNTKDKGELVYLTAFGTALDKGDYGAVGRGNKYQGFISLNRETNIEAVCGKNPMNHSGKLYTIMANDLSWKIYQLTKMRTLVYISARNGDLIASPQNVIVRIGGIVDDQVCAKIENLIKSTLENSPHLTDQIITNNPINHHINHRLYLC